MQLVDRACLVDPPAVRPEPCLLACGDHRATQLADIAGSGRVVVVIIQALPMFLALCHRLIAAIITAAAVIPCDQVSFLSDGLFSRWLVGVRHLDSRSTAGRAVPAL